MTRSTAALLCAVAVLSLALVAGCGGDSEADRTATTVSMPDYLKRANAACREERAGLEQRVADFRRERRGRWPREVLLAELAHNVILPTIENEMEGVRAIRAPKGEAGRVNRYLYLEELALSNIVFMKRLPSLDAIWREFAQSGKRLSEYGLPDCANGPGTHPELT